RRGGPSGSNRSLRRSTNGVTSPQPGSAAGRWSAAAGGSNGTGLGVGCQSPGLVPGVYMTKVVAWSVLLSATMAAAAAVPMAIPSLLASPSGMAASAATYAASTCATAIAWSAGDPNCGNGSAPTAIAPT